MSLRALSEYLIFLARYIRNRVCFFLFDDKEPLTSIACQCRSQLPLLIEGEAAKVFSVPMLEKRKRWWIEATLVK